MPNKLLEAYLVRPQICPNPVFIIGSPRSGTSVLAWSLAQHSKLWTSAESDFFFDLFGEGRVEKAFESARGRPDGTWLFKENVEKSEFLGFLGLGLNALITSRSCGKRWVDQTPLYTLIVGMLAEMFPGAFFLHILRDGRRVVNSMINFQHAVSDDVRAEIIKTGRLPPWANDFQDACRTWTSFVEIAMTFSSVNPSRCLTVTNEKLVANPIEGFSEIYQLLGISYEEKPIEFFRSNRINSSFKQGESSSPQTVQAWPNPWDGWNLDQKSVFLQEAAPALIKYGLATEHELKLSTYDQVVSRTRQTVRTTLPSDATVIAVSEGDGHLLNSDGPKLWHFPQAEDGTYAGHHPADSAEAIQHLEMLRAKGGNFLLFPSTAFWWLDYYVEFNRYLESNHEVVARDDSCVIFRLNRPAAEAGHIRKRIDLARIDPVERDRRDMEGMRILLSSTLAQDSNCVDVGAHKGSVLKQFMKFAPNGRHIAYEPLPELYAQLVQKFPQVDVRLAALSNERREKAFTHVKTDPGYSGFRPRSYPGQEELETIQVRVEDLDSSLPPDYVPRLIKIDVEGAEREVIEGSIRTIKTYKPVVIFEHGRGAANHYGTSPAHIFELLCTTAGLRIFDLEGNGPFNLEEFSEIFEKGTCWNFVAHE